MLTPFTVSTHELYMDNGDKLANRWALVNDDTGKVLSPDPVSSNYVKNMQQPAELLDRQQYLIDKAGMEYVDSGLLRGGQIIWSIAKTGKGVSVAGDTTEQYITTLDSYNKMVPHSVMGDALRLLCTNQLHLLKDAYKVPHSREFSLAEFISATEQALQGWDSYTTFAEQSPYIGISKEAIFNYLITIFGNPDNEDKAKQLKKKHIKNTIELFYNSVTDTHETKRNTVWGAFNAVTEYVDHHLEARTESNTMYSRRLGSGAIYKEKAYGAALKLINSSNEEK